MSAGNEAAFPLPAEGAGDGCDGLTKREYFAAAALSGASLDPRDIDSEEIARAAVRVADALLVALSE